MKLQDTHTNGTGCCKEQADQNPKTGCCSQETTTSQPCCCSEEATWHEPCCCNPEDGATPTSCCSEAETEAQPCCVHEKDTGDQSSETLHPDINSLEVIKGLLKEANDKYVRLYAEFENFKKRATKERIALTDKANEQTLKELLPIKDDFERCIMALQGTQALGQHIEGIKLIYDKLGSLLRRHGVREIAIEQGSVFNEDLHEAIMQQPVDNLEMKGKIVTVVEKGYLINEYVLRFAKVIIGV